MNIVIAGGGTGGHLFCGIAVYECLKVRTDIYCDVRFIGSKTGLEASVLPDLEIPVSFIPVVKLRTSGIVGRMKSLAMLPISILSSIGHLRKLAPDVVLGVGGYASGPVVLAACLMRIPTALIEQNAVAGFTNRVLGRWAKKVFLGLPGAESAFRKEQAEFVGNPVRVSLTEIPPVDSVPAPFTVLVFGGSQGARRINELVTGALKMLGNLKSDIQFLHVTGEHDYPWVSRAYRTESVRAEVLKFTNDMYKLYARAHFVIGRSGALTVSELAAAGRGALLIPYPYAVDDHQAANARYLVDRDAAFMIRQHELTEKKLADVIVNMINEPKKFIHMGELAGSLATPDAARRIADWLVERGGTAS
ncbi:MAG: undecaprenyldiphospho-muramoylpentapeptide beta-N-acetylglucosaminyltransferase [Deltaproteobacteria bacterium]|nr:undecaprenyldiphospho-muramoylpentapeptide beta-N-acetylglucosaminyltransferase [Candidatus Zymogenaceae bacterium]